MSDSWIQLLSDPNPWVAPQPLPAPITTERLIVRLYQRGDGPALFESVVNERDALLPWIPWALTDHHDESDSIYFVERCRRAVENPGCLDFPMGIFDRQTGVLVGGTGLHRIRPQTREGEVGYWVRKSRQGQGLCTEATGALISQALTAADQGGWGFRRIVVYNAAGNLASRRVCEKLGLRLEARMKGRDFLGTRGPHGGVLGYQDVLGFAVLADEWDYAQRRAKAHIGWSNHADGDIPAP